MAQVFVYILPGTVVDNFSVLTRDVSFLILHQQRLNVAGLRPCRITNYKGLPRFSGSVLHAYMYVRHASLHVQGFFQEGGRGGNLPPLERFVPPPPWNWHCQVLCLWRELQMYAPSPPPTDVRIAFPPLRPNPERNPVEVRHEGEISLLTQACWST